jgi:chemotaxis protein methyltransferase CheR
MEPYSLAMVIDDLIANVKSWDVKILATDIDTNMLEIGTEGVYPAEALEKIPRAYRKYIDGDSRIQKNSGSIQVSNKLKKLISFKQLNLLHEFPMSGLFDVIFCRNVVIYFNKETQKILFEKFANVLKPGGYLYIGHSENLFKVTERFELLGQTIYRKIK